MTDGIDEKFKGLDTSLLIGEPLRAAAAAQMMLSEAMVDFVNEVCVNDTDDKKVENVESKKNED